MLHFSWSSFDFGRAPSTLGGPLDFGRDESLFFNEPFFVRDNEVNGDPGPFFWHNRSLKTPVLEDDVRCSVFCFKKNDSFGWIDDFYVSCWECRQGHPVFVQMMFKYCFLPETVDVRYHFEGSHPYNVASIRVKHLTYYNNFKKNRPTKKTCKTWSLSQVPKVVFALARSENQRLRTFYTSTHATKHIYLPTQPPRCLG